MTAQTIRIQHSLYGQPPETSGKLVTLWFREDRHDIGKHAPVPADEIDWDMEDDPVVFYAIEGTVQRKEAAFA